MDLKHRAGSVVYSKYKEIKREINRKEQQRRLNWFRSIVVAKKWTAMLLNQARIDIRVKREQENERAEQE